jgi:hypothetical protein
MPAGLSGADMRKRTLSPPAMMRRNQHQPIEYYLLDRVRCEGALLGYLGGEPIRAAAVDDWGRRYEFAGVVSFRADGQYDLRCVKPGEFIVEPGLIYRLQERPSAPSA